MSKSETDPNPQTSAGFVPDPTHVATVKTEHAAAMEAGRNALAHAKAAGEALIALAIPHGQAEAVYKTCGISARTAQAYQQVARNWSVVKKADADSIASALRAIANPKPSTQREPTPKLSPAKRVTATVAEAREAVQYAIDHATDITTESQRVKVREEIAAVRDLLEQLDKALNGSEEVGHRRSAKVPTTKAA